MYAIRSYYVSRLQHPVITEVRSAGLMMAVELREDISLADFLHHALDRGILSDFFLFDHHAFRIAPPLVISQSEVDLICDELVQVMEKYR